MNLRYLIGLLAAVIALPATANDYPLSVRSCARDVSFAQAPQRVVVHDVNMTAMLLHLGLRERIVGYTGFTRNKHRDPWIDQALDGVPQLASRYPSIETLLAADTQMFFAGWNYGMHVGGPVTPATLAPFGIAVYELSAPVDLGRNRIVPILDHFLEQHPSISVDLNMTDGYLDLAGLGIDFAIRYGALSDSTMRVRKISEGRRVVCASPAYLAAHGTPMHPSELVDHQCILMRFGSSIHREWQFRAKERNSKVLVSGRRIANDGEQVRQWCLNGHGICIKSYIDVRDDLSAGRLVEVLGAYSLTGVDLQIVYPSGYVVPRRVKLLTEEISLKTGSLGQHQGDLVSYLESASQSREAQAG
ncbi:LysR substrate-binding domain-containing protein [Pseudomonas promysalinigenes]|uniref:LysR substrate-binding domain-containing protein n=1 Tax=Pseudomonas promysalinigenes TaxID=485898 RepID=UPI0039170034